MQNILLKTTIISLLICIATHSFGQVYVKKDAPGPTHDGTTWATAYTDLQAAMDAATAGTEIWIAAGTYLPTASPDDVSSDPRDKAFHLNKNLKIYGGFAGSETLRTQRNPVTNKVILSGDLDNNDTDISPVPANGLTIENNEANAYHVFITADLTTDAIFDGLNITGGNANTVSVFITYNSINYYKSAGAGLYSYASSPTINNCNIYNNKATDGGGQVNYYSSSPRMSNCNIYNNSGSNGGGQYNSFSSHTILSNCNIYNNRATDGGGQFNSSSSPIINNCNIYNNIASNNGGGQYNSSSSSPNLTNCIFWENKKGGSATTAGADIENDSSTPTITYSITQVYVGGTGSLLDSDPRYVDAANGDFHLQQSSPAIDAGTASGAPATDFVGTARPQGAGFDMGVFEFDYTTITRLYVDIDATGANNGLSWTDAFNDLQTAMDKGILNTTTVAEIWIAEGTYLPTASPDDVSSDPRDKAFHLDKDLKIYGGFAGIETLLTQRNPVTNKVILSGDLDNNNAYHVFITVNLTSAAILDGLNITEGNAVGNESITFSSKTFERSKGGGQYNISSPLSIFNCNIYNNSASFNGGGQYNISSPLSIFNCNIYNNSARIDGGGQYNDSCSPSITNSNIYNNSANNGGGQYNMVSNTVIRNSNIYNNSASINGGGQNNYASSPVIRNSNIYNNSADNGGGQYNYSSVSFPNIRNCIFWENKKNEDASVAGADIENDDATPSISYSITQVYTEGTNNRVGSDPRFTDAANADFTLMGCSPAIDAGNNSGVTSTDAAGNPRIYNSKVDMGAYERQSPKAVFDLTAPLATLAKTYQSIETVANGDWINYCGCEGDNPVLLLSLKTAGSGAVIPKNGITVKIESPFVTYYAPNTGFITNPEGAALMNRRWNVNATTPPTSDVGVRFYYTDADYAAINSVMGDEGKTQLTNQNQMSFYKVTDNSLGAFPAIASVPSSKVVLLKNGASPSTTAWTLTEADDYNYAEFLVSSFSGGGGGSGPDGTPLPVTLVSFTAHKNAQSAILHWTTTSESQNQGFEIQRSVNNLHFLPVGYVDGKGTYTGKQEYTFTDTQMEAGNNYYRLKQLDFDGTYTYSRILNLENNTAIETKVYPMPVTDALTIDYHSLLEEDLQITLLSPAGTVQYSKAFKVVKGKNTLHLDFAPVKSGAYLIQMTSPKTSVVRHLMKQ